MPQRTLAGAVILLLTLVGFYRFPGHTFLQSDTQIYMPMLEHYWDAGTLSNDLTATHPHLSFTIYDEVALGLRRLTRLDFQHVLQLEQIVFRFCGILGAYLTATSLGLGRLAALLVTSIFSLGATIAGPAVLTFEYEPVPRGYAVPLLMAAVGFAAHGRMFASEVFAAIAFLYHPPTVYPFWAVYFLLTLWPSNPATMKRRILGLVPIFTALVLMLILSRHQAGVVEQQAFFERIPESQEQLQRMRASYNWVSVWWRGWMVQYLFLWLLGLAAFYRLRRHASQELKFFGLGMPIIGIISVPASYVLLERLKWSMIPQFQPVRALLFITAFAGIFCAVAAVKAAERCRPLEALVWLVVPYAIPMQAKLWDLVSGFSNPLMVRRAALAIALAAVSALAAWALAAKRRWALPALAAAILAPFLLIPGWAKVRNYPDIESPELDQLAAWARASTPKETVFLFPDAGRDLVPGVFRVRALRAVYADWKAGGQVNFHRRFGEEWWQRWQKSMSAKFDPDRLDRYRDLGIDYVVLQRKNALRGREPAFENSRFAVYRIRSAGAPPSPTGARVRRESGIGALAEECLDFRAGGDRRLRAHPRNGNRCRGVGES